jgi:hypothetical protein
MDSNEEKAEACHREMEAKMDANQEKTNNGQEDIKNLASRIFDNQEEMRARVIR